MDVGLLGGNAASSLGSAVFCVVRSVLAAAVLLGFAYGGLTGETAHSAHTREILFSIFCALLVTLSYHMSRSSSDPTVILSLIKRQLLMTGDEAAVVAGTVNEGGGTEENQDGKPKDEEEEGAGAASTPMGSQASATSAMEDPLPRKLGETVIDRLKHDLIVCTLIALVTFLLHWSGLFSRLQPDLNYVLWVVASWLGFLCHYAMPQLRKQLPWLCFAHPLLKSHEYDMMEVRQAAKVTWFERLYVWGKMAEKNVVYPMVFLSALTMDVEYFRSGEGPHPLWGALLLCMSGLKCLRAAYSDCSKQYMVLLTTVLLFQFDPSTGNIRGDGRVKPDGSFHAPFILNYFLVSMIFQKAYEFYLKVQFVVTYIAPWQITWGSAFHAFAQPFSVPHSAMLFVQVL